MFPYRTAFFTLLGVIVGALLATGVFMGVKMYKWNKSIMDKNPRMPEQIDGKNFVSLPPVPPLPTEAPHDNIVAGDDEYGSFNTFENQGGGIRMYDARTYPTSSMKIEWNGKAEKLTQAEIDNLQVRNVKLLFQDKMGDLLCDYSRGDIESADQAYYEGACNLLMYKIGTVTAPAHLSGKTLYLTYRGVPGMGLHFGHAYAIYDDTREKFVLFDRLLHGSDYELKELASGAQWLHGIVPYNIAFHELKAPEMLRIPGETSTLKYEKYLGNPDFPGFGGVHAYANLGGLINIFTGQTYETYGPSEVVFTDPVYGDVYFRDDGYHIIMPDGSVKIYDLNPYFLILAQPIKEKSFYRAGYDALIDWNSGIPYKNERYELSGDIKTEGCGAGVARCTNIVNEKKWFNPNNLVEIGRTKAGEAVYELSDKASNWYYREMFKFGYEGAKTMTYDRDGLTWEESQAQLKSMTDEQKYQDFLDDVPLFFWKDYRGKWRVYKKEKYKTLAECAKPVIYLYPEKEQDVHVRVEPNGGFTETIPEYPEDGWAVRATPDSKIHNYDDGESYPYLFWEGVGYDYEQPKQGFVFAKDDVNEGVRKLLSMQGLNEKESDDFMEFWLPRLTEKAYVFVTFVSQEHFDELAPLTVEPKPDTVIRVFMDYTLLDEPISVEPLKLGAPERNGFTVVEWGGARHW